MSVATAGGTSAPRFDLPPGLRSEIRRNVTFLAVLGAAGHLLYLIVDLVKGGGLESLGPLWATLDSLREQGVPLRQTLAFLTPFEKGLLAYAIDLAGNAAGTLLCLLLLIAALARRIIVESSVLTIVLVVEVLACFMISLETPWTEFATSGRIPTLTWVTFIILILPLIVPMPWRKALIGAVGAALTVPLGLWLLNGLGVFDPSVVPPTTGDGAQLTVPYLRTTLPPVVAVFGALLGAIRAAGSYRHFGNYEVVSLIGRGGRGEVWRAKHRFLDMHAAIKLIRDDLLRGSGRRGREAAIAEFYREAAVTSQLRSVSTVRLYDFGKRDDGTLYHTMELLDGIALDELVARYGPLPPGRVLFFLRQLCDSLEEAHNLDLIHRDIKPGNIMVCRLGRDTYDRIKVLDFGIAKPIGKPGQTPRPWNGLRARVKRGKETETLGLHTVDGVAKGTPGYMAPEQIMKRDVDARTDIYSLGCVVYHMLTKRPVFHATSEEDLLELHRDFGTPILPSKWLDGPESPIPPELEAIVSRCLEKNPDERPSSIREIREGVKEIPMDWCAERAKVWWTEHMPAREKK
jgi:serine/threonine-protein kinase